MEDYKKAEMPLCTKKERPCGTADNLCEAFEITLLLSWKSVGKTILDSVCNVRPNLYGVSGFYLGSSGIS